MDCDATNFKNCLYLGLGLSTAKRLIEAQGETIKIDCPPTGGTTVTLRLPLAAARSHNAPGSGTDS
jgi:K+-sensing histidine kinase KdpD